MNIDDSKTKRNIAIKRTGDMMLSGWKLLSTSCPICCSALLSKNEHMRCPFCDLPVMHEEKTVLTSTNPNPSSISTDKIENLAETDVIYSESSEPKHYESLEQAKKEYDLHNKSMVAVSSKIGEKMLSGWTMLSDICPFQSCKGTPIMQSPGLDSLMLCVACDRTFGYNKFGELISVAQIKSSNLEVSTTTNSNIKNNTVHIPIVVDNISNNESSFYSDMNNAPILDTNFASFSSKIDDSSSKLSKKLLMGWAMLEQCCTNYAGGCSGNVPLMRDLTGQIRCVQCNFPDHSVAVVLPPPPPAVVSVSAAALLVVPSTTLPLLPNQTNQNALSNTTSNTTNSNTTTANDNNNNTIAVHLSTKETCMRNILHVKLEKAIEDLELTDCIDTSIKLTELIIKLKQAIQLLE